HCARYYRRFRELVESGKGCIEAVVLKEEGGAAPGSRYLFDAEGRMAAQMDQGVVPQNVTRNLPPLRQRPRPVTLHSVSYLPVLPRITLLIVGGGHVGQAVGRLAAEAGFDVWVLDDRERYANRERFPAAKRIMVGDIGSSWKELAGSAATPYTYRIIVPR